jgi:hypothetical protein
MLQALEDAEAIRIQLDASYLRHTRAELSRLLDTCLADGDDLGRLVSKVLERRRTPQTADYVPPDRRKEV